MRLWSDQENNGSHSDRVPKKTFSQDLTGIHNFTPEAIEWIKTLDIDIFL